MWISSGYSLTALQSLLAPQLMRLTQLHLLSNHTKDPIFEMAPLSDHSLGCSGGSLPPEMKLIKLMLWKVKTFVTAPGLFQQSPASLP